MPRCRHMTSSYFFFLSVEPLTICVYGCFHRSKFDPSGRCSISIRIFLQSLPQPQQHKSTPFSNSSAFFSSLNDCAACWHRIGCFLADIFSKVTTGKHAHEMGTIVINVYSLWTSHRHFLTMKCYTIKYMMNAL